MSYITKTLLNVIFQLTNNFSTPKNIPILYAHLFTSKIIEYNR